MERLVRELARRVGPARFTYSEGVEHSLRDRRAGRHKGQIDETHVLFKVGYLDRAPRLPDSARTAQGQQALLFQEHADVARFIHAADEACELGRDTSCRGMFGYRPPFRVARRRT